MLHSKTYNIIYKISSVGGMKQAEQWKKLSTSRNRLADSKRSKTHPKLYFETVLVTSVNQKIEIAYEIKENTLRDPRRVLEQLLIRFLIKSYSLQQEKKSHTCQTQAPTELKWNPGIMRTSRRWPIYFSTELFLWHSFIWLGSKLNIKV
jgi:hypothetical protein